MVTSGNYIIPMRFLALLFVKECHNPPHILTVEKPAPLPEKKCIILGMVDPIALTNNIQYYHVGWLKPPPFF